MSSDYPENPYSADADVNPRGDHHIKLPDGQKRGKVGQVTILGILMAIYGGILGMAGLGMIAYGLLMPEALKNNPAFKDNPAFQNDPNMPPPEEFMEIMAMAMGGIGVGLCVAALLYFISGIMVTKFSGRGFALFTLSAGLLTILFCYCLPTSIGMFAYGLIVLVDPSVKMAFELGAKGHNAKEIQHAFGQLPLGQ